MSNPGAITCRALKTLDSTLKSDSLTLPYNPTTVLEILAFGPSIPSKDGIHSLRRSLGLLFRLAFLPARTKATSVGGGISEFLFFNASNSLMLLSYSSLLIVVSSKLFMS